MRFHEDFVEQSSFGWGSSFEGRRVGENIGIEELK